MPKLAMRDGARLNVLDVGARRGPACILLHGFGMQGAMWLPVIAPLLARQRFILPDLRGFGGSHHLSLGPQGAISQHADDLADLIAALKLRDVRLAGLSMGACTAMEHHARHGFDGIARYLHIDQAPCILNGNDWDHVLLGHEQDQQLPRWAAMLNRIEPYADRPFDDVPAELRQQYWTVLREFLGYAFASPLWKQTRHFTRVDALARRVIPTANWGIYLQTMRAYVEGGLDWRGSMRTMDRQTTLFIGGRSTMYPAAGQRELGRLIPGAKVVEFPRAGHTVPFESPLRFVREFDRFLRAA